MAGFPEPEVGLVISESSDALAADGQISNVFTGQLADAWSVYDSSGQEAELLEASE